MIQKKKSPESENRFRVDYDSGTLHPAIFYITGGNAK